MTKTLSIQNNSQISFVLLVLATGLLLLDGCGAKPRQTIPRYEGTINYLGSHNSRVLGNDVVEDVLAYVAKYGKNGWVSGLTDDRLLPGENWPKGLLTGVRVKDLFYAVYECKLQSKSMVTIADHFDPADHDKEISKVIAALVADAANVDK